MELDLQKIREDIDRIDRSIVAGFEERMNVVLRVAEYKKSKGIPILDAEREKQVIAKNKALLQNKDYENALESVLEKMMSVSRNLQQKMLSELQFSHDFVSMERECEKSIVVGYQGVPGSFSQQALQEQFAGCNYREEYFLNFEDVFQAVEAQQVEYGVLPIENSSTGAVNDIYDLLNKYDVCIVDELSLKIEQCLLVKPGTSLQDIRQVYSHPQGFKQSKEFLAQYPHWEQIEYFNTAKSAQYVAESTGQERAAIAGRQVASIYPLEVLQSNINFNGKNHTRFIVISKMKKIFPDSNKISLIISLPHKAGSLARLLNCFEEHNINLLKLESRPNQEENWTYYFYIDFSGNLHSPEVLAALNKVCVDSIYFKILGNYPAHRE